MGTTTKKVQPKDYHTAITVNATAEEALKKINQVNKWWAKNQ